MEKDMVLSQKRFVLGGMLLLLVLLLVACDSGGSNSPNGNTAVGSPGNQQSTPTTAITPQLVIPKSASGSAGKGPLVISSPTLVPGGNAGSQQVILGDRTLIINGASKQKGADTNTSLINLDLTVQNTSDKTIMNQSTFFELIGPEGDTFGYQYNSSDTFYGPIAAHTTRAGTIGFQVPTAATASLHLLYRPEVGAKSVIVLLKVS